MVLDRKDCKTAASTLICSLLFALALGCGGGATGDGGGGGGGAIPAGWLYTSGSKIYVSDGAGSGTQWMGRGVNVDDIFFCGYNYGLWMENPESTFITMISGLMTNWKPNFIRLSLSMNSGNGAVTSWLTNAEQYKTPMTEVINAIGNYPNTYVLVTLRSDTSMVETNPGNEATFIPQAATDDTYRALVDSFANSNFVMFGLSNEPGTISPANLVPVMEHAVSVIRAEEDRLGVPHHIISVQGRQWTSDISFYNTSPLPYDNLVYEVHGYEPTPDSYTHSNIPVIIGEYGPAPSYANLQNSTTFYADLESKQIPNLAWDFEPFSNCMPDLLNVTHSATNITPNTWGSTVQAYLLAHASP